MATTKYRNYHNKSSNNRRTTNKPRSAKTSANSKAKETKKDVLENTVVDSEEITKKLSIEELEKINTLEENSKVEEVEAESVEIETSHDIEDESEQIEEKRDNYKLESAPRYYGYGFRLVRNIFFLIILLAALVFVAFKYISVESEDVVNYTENGKINYKVYLKDNNYYDNNVVNEDIYVASLINKIEINYDYDFLIENAIDCDFNYDIYALLVIKDDASDKVYMRKRYDLAVNNKDSITSQKKHSIEKKVDVDYKYYNSLASNFRTEYGVGTESYLRVVFNVNKNSSSVNIHDSNMYVDIPLTERAINISISPMGLNNYSQTITEKTVKFNDRTYLVAIIVIALLALLELVSIIKLLSKLTIKKTKYQKYLAKLLREYDRLIVEVSVNPDFGGKTVIKISEFKELLDLRDNFKKPIMFHEVIKNHKAYFYLVDDNDLYVYTVKSSDLEK